MVGTGAASRAAAAAPAGGAGRVVATISVLEGTVRMPGVEVELKTADEKMTLAKTVTDGAGQVNFPMCRPAATSSRRRPRFISQDSAQFDVQSGETAQVLARHQPGVHRSSGGEVRGTSPVEPPEPVLPLEPVPVEA